MIAVGNGMQEEDDDDDDDDDDDHLCLSSCSKHRLILIVSFF